MVWCIESASSLRKNDLKDIVCKLVYTMKIEQASRNFEILSNLPKGTRLHTTDSSDLSYDNRWFLGVRRTLDRSSRIDIIVPIYATFACVAESDKKSIKEIVECINHLKKQFEILYPEFEKFQTFLNTLETFLVIYVGDSSTKKESNEYVGDVLYYINELDECINNICDPKQQSQENDHTEITEIAEIETENIPNELYCEDIESTEFTKKLDILNIPNELYREDAERDTISEKVDVTLD